MTIKRYLTTAIISKTVCVHQCPAIDLADPESLPTVDVDVAAGSLMSVDVQPSSAVGLADLECLPIVDGDDAAGSSMSVDV